MSLIYHEWCFPEDFYLKDLKSIQWLLQYIVKQGRLTLIVRPLRWDFWDNISSVCYINWCFFSILHSFAPLSRNHRMARVGRNLKYNSVPTPCHRQEHFTLDKVAPRPVHPGLEHFKGWGVHSLPGQLFFFERLPSLYYSSSFFFFFLAFKTMRYALFGEEWWMIAFHIKET